MSSNDRQNRSNRQRPAPAISEPVYEVDVLFEDEWDVDFDEPYPAQPQDLRNASSPTQRPSSAQSPNEGTAAQLDRLRRSLSRSTRPAASKPAPSPVNRPTSAAARRVPPADDIVYPDDSYDEQGYVQPRAASRTTPPRQRQASQSPGRQDVAGYDEVDVYDDFDDGFSEYDAARPPARAPRSTPQLKMPTITKPTLPAAIAQADLVNDAPSLGIIGIGLASLAAMAIVVANQSSSLAPEFATHVSASGVLEDFMGESAIWKLPLMAAMFTLMNIVVAWFVSPIDRFASRFVLAGAVIVQFVAWVALLRIL